MPTDLHDVIYHWFYEKNAWRISDLLRASRAKRVVDVRFNFESQLAGFAKKDDLAPPVSLPWERGRLTRMPLYRQNRRKITNAFYNLDNRYENCRISISLT